MALIDFDIKDYDSNGWPDWHNLSEPPNMANSKLVKFAETGIGKPLCVQIITAYVGDVPQQILGGDPALLITSTLKGAATYEVQQRAVNMVKDKIQDFKEVDFSANIPGTSIVYYSPALKEQELIISFEMIAEKFDGKAIETLTKCLMNASKIPIFLAGAAYLVVGANILNIASQLGKKLFKAKPFFKEASLKLNWGIGGLSNFTPGIKLVCNNEDRDFFIQNFDIAYDGSPEFNERYSLRNKKDKQYYKEERPYMLIRVDGAPRRDLESFQPKLASSAILSKFFGENNQLIREGFETLDSALQIKKDFDAINEINALRKRMSQLNSNSIDYQNLKTAIEVEKANIYSSEIKNIIDKLTE